MNFLNSIKHEVDITAGLSSPQIQDLNNLMLKYRDESEDRDLLNSTIIIDKIEEIVNKLYKAGMIKSIEIKQNTETEYEFNDLLADLKFDRETLVLNNINDMTLEDWLLQNFPAVKNQNSDPVVASNSSD